MSIEELEAEGLTPLTYFANALAQLNFPTAHQPATPAQAEHLLVAAGVDHAGHKLMLRLSPMDAALLQGNEALLEFLLVFPGQASRQQLAELNQLAAYLNRLAPVGAFLASPEKGLCYRYLLLTDTPWVSLNLLVRVIQNLVETAQYCGPFFSACLEGTDAKQIIARLEVENAQH